MSHHWRIPGLIPGLIPAAALGGSMLSVGLAEAATSQICVSATSPARLESDATGTYCSVSVTAYQHYEMCNGTANGLPAVSGDPYLRLPSGQTYTMLCAADFAAATADAGRYFAANATGGYPFRITIPAGTYYVPDISNTEQSAVVSLPITNGSGAAPVSAAERLIITGTTNSNGENLTTLLSNWQLHTLVAAPGKNPTNPQPFSHLTVQDINFDRDQFATSQGGNLHIISVTETVTTVTGGNSTQSLVKTPGLTMVLSPATTGQPGFNTPDFNFQPAATPPNSTGNGGYQQYFRLYDNVLDTQSGVLTPMMDAAVNGSVNGSIANAVFNDQIFFHGVCGGAIATPLDDYALASSTSTTTASFACPSAGNTYTLLLGTGPGPLHGSLAQAIASYAAIPASANPIVCLKNEGNTGNFMIIENEEAKNPSTGAYTPGSDIVLSHLVLRGAARAAFINTTNVSILNVTVAREPAMFGQAPCLSSDAGGFQIVGTAPWVTYGNVIDGLTATATGDDSLALFGDTGGINNTPVTTITNSHISDSFVRGVLVMPPAAQPASDIYLSNIDVYPYAGFNSQASECSGNALLGEPGFDQTTPAGNCAFPAGSNSITDIYVDCPFAANTATNNDVYCPVHIGTPPAATAAAAIAAPATVFVVRTTATRATPVSRTELALRRLRLTASQNWGRRQ